jgi:hypothetical protein
MELVRTRFHGSMIFHSRLVLHGNMLTYTDAKVNFQGQLRSVQKVIVFIASTSPTEHVDRVAASFEAVSSCKSVSTGRSKSRVQSNFFGLDREPLPPAFQRPKNGLDFALEPVSRSKIARFGT